MEHPMSLNDDDKAWINSEIEKTEHRIVEAMRNMQTELLRGFEAFAVPQTIRLKKIEADQSNLDAAISGRVEVLETRLHQIEMRLLRGEK
jgi:hypothetical protein